MSRADVGDFSQCDMEKWTANLKKLAEDIMSYCCFQLQLLLSVSEFSTIGIKKEDELQGFNLKHNDFFSQYCYYCFCIFKMEMQHDQFFVMAKLILTDLQQQMLKLSYVAKIYEGKCFLTLKSILKCNLCQILLKKLVS